MDAMEEEMGGNADAIIGKVSDTRVNSNLILIKSED